VETTPQARLRPAELHIGESLSLLVRLIAERIRPLYQTGLREQIGSGSGGARRRRTRRSGRRRSWRLQLQRV